MFYKAQHASVASGSHTQGKKRRELPKHLLWIHSFSNRVKEHCKSEDIGDFTDQRPQVLEDTQNLCACKRVRWLGHIKI